MNARWGKRSAGPTRHVDPDGAIASYLEELRQAEVAGAPTPASALNGLGDAHLDKGDVLSAVDYYRQAAEVYEGEGMHDNAIACCRKILRHAPDDDRVGLMLGRFYAVKGLRSDAVRELDAFADRAVRGGRRKDAIEALREVVRLDPQRPESHERLGRQLVAEGQRDEAEAELGTAMDRYRTRGDGEGIQRVRSEIVSLKRPAPPAGTPPAPQAETEFHAPPPPSPQPAGPPPGPAEPLELEPTLYGEAPAAAAPVAESAPPPPAESEPHDPRPPASGLFPEGAEIAALAARLYAAGQWGEAVAAYRRLAQGDQAGPDEFSAWAESARQAGEASLVLEALAAAARWNLGRGDRVAARRAAEEMLLLDPDSAIATDILERVGTSLPRG